MKIGVWLSKSFMPTEGGGFSYYDILIDAIDKHNFNNVDITFISTGKSIEGRLRKEILALPKIYLLGYKISKKLLEVFPFRISTGIYYLFEKMINDYLSKNGVQVIFYPLQNDGTLTNFPFVSNNWDIGHRATFAFPELMYDGVFERREQWYTGYILKALLVFCESEAGKREVIRHTGISEEKVKVVPLFAGRSILTEIDSTEQSTSLSKFGLQKCKYFFYPAQFWAHKNHYGLLMAFSIVLKNKPDQKLILTGSDKGILDYVKSLIPQMGLQNNVVFAGFVTNEEISALYQNASALVMTTFFGPTNMPLLEALALKCPVLCTDLEGHREIMHDAALYFSATDHNEIAMKMEQILRKEIRDELLSKADKVLVESKFNIEHAINSLDVHFNELSKIRNCWQ